MNTDTLHDLLADQATRPPLRETGLGEVRRRAGRIRRRRNATTLAGAALVVLAVVVPAGVLGGRATGPTPPEPVAPTTTPSTPATPAPVARPRSLDLVPAGAEPRLAYTLDDVLHEPGGYESDVPWPRDVTSWTPYAGGYLTDDGDVLRQYGARGQVVATWTPSSPPKVSPDGSRVAWAGSGRVYESAPDGSDRRSWDRPLATSVAGFLPDALVVNDGEGVVVQHSDGRVTALPARLLFATSADPAAGLLAVRAGRDQRSEVVDVRGRTVWRAGERDLGQFSPDGRLVWSTSPEADAAGIRNDRVDLLDAGTGSVVATLDLSRVGALVRDVAWEDADHVLVVVSDARTEQATAVRLGRDGTLYRAVPLRSTDRAGAVVFSGDPSR